MAARYYDVDEAEQLPLLGHPENPENGASELDGAVAAVHFADPIDVDDQLCDGEAAADLIPGLPAETWLVIMSYMPTKDRLRLAMTSVAFRHLLNDRTLWTARHITIHQPHHRPKFEDLDHCLGISDFQEGPGLQAGSLPVLAGPGEHISGYESPLPLNAFVAPEETKRKNGEDDVLWFELGETTVKKAPHKQRLTPISRLILRRYGHHIEHLSVLVEYGCVCLRRSTIQILRKLSGEWRLKSLTLILDSFQHNLKGYFKTLPHSDSGLCMANEILRKAINLEKLDIQLWNVPARRLDTMWMRRLLYLSRRSPNISPPPSMTIAAVLMEAPTCPRLRELDIAGQGPCASMSSADNIHWLVYKFSFLTRLSLRHFMLNNRLFEFFCTTGRAPLQTLEVQVSHLPGDCCYWGSVSNGPRVDKPAWVRLTSSFPDLKVHLLIRSGCVDALNWALVEWVPVSVLSVAEDAQMGFDLVKIVVWQNTLSKVFLANPTTPCCDMVLLHVVASCPSLQHLAFAGEIRCKVLMALARLDRQWVTFSFRHHQLMHHADNDFPPSSLEASCPVVSKKYHSFSAWSV